MAVVSASVHDLVGRRLAEVDQRYTAGRRALVDVLARAGRPLTVPEIVAANEELAQSSAYRNVTSLVELGVLRRLRGSEDHDRFELAEALSHHHHHLVCIDCGRVEDVELSLDLEQTLREAVRVVGATHGFSAVEHRLDVLGRCRACERRRGRATVSEAPARRPVAPPAPLDHRPN